MAARPTQKAEPTRAGRDAFALKIPANPQQSTRERDTTCKRQERRARDTGSEAKGREEDSRVHHRGGKSPAWAEGGAESDLSDPATELPVDKCGEERPPS